MVTDDDVEKPTRGCRVGGPSASTCFLIVLLWIPNSRSIARSDIPLRLVIRIAFHRSFWRNVGLRAEAAAGLLAEATSPIIILGSLPSSDRECSGSRVSIQRSPKPSTPEVGTGWAGRHWALPFLTALVVSARYDRRKGRRHKTVTDYARQMLVCLRRWLPDRDLVVVADGGCAKREFLRHCQSMSKPIVVVTKLRKEASLYQPAPPRRPGQIGRPRVVGARLPSPTAVLDDPATQWTPCRATGSDGSTAMVELASGVALWYHGGPPRLPIRWVVIRYLEERRGPYALLCTDTEAEPLRILQWYLLRRQVEVTFEELRAHLGMETQRQWSERAIARTTPALFGLFSVVTLAADILIEQRGGMAPRTAAWYDKTSPSFADAIAMVRRHLWVQQGTFMPSEREHESIKVPRLLYHRMLDTLVYAA